MHLVMECAAIFLYNDVRFILRCIDNSIESGLGV